MVIVPLPCNTVSLGVTVWVWPSGSESFNKTFPETATLTIVLLKSFTAVVVLGALGLLTVTNCFAVEHNAVGYYHKLGKYKYLDQ